MQKMTDTITKGEFVELDYDAYITEDHELFDTTRKDAAEKHHLHAHKEFKPVVICVGEGQTLPGLDQALEGAILGTHTIHLKAESAFGKKDAKLLQLIPRRVFKEQEVQPLPGLEINVDGQVGIIRSASGGRVIVDFNHPLAGKDVTYEVTINRKVEGKEERLKALLALLGMPYKSLGVEEDVATIAAGKLPPQLIDHLKKDFIRLTGLKDVQFVAEEPKKEEKL